MGKFNERVNNPEEFKLDSALQERINFLYNLEPAQDNMFICSPIYTNDESPSTYNITPSVTEAPQGKAKKGQILTTAPYRLHSASFNMPKIKTAEYPRLRKNLIEGVEMNQNFTLEWIDDCFHSIRKYHLDWFHCWYTRELDLFTTTANNGRYRSFQIYMYHMIHKADNNGGDKIIPHVWGIIDVRDAFPIDLGSIELGPDAGNSLYKCGYMGNYIDIRLADTEEGAYIAPNGKKDILENMGFSDAEATRLVNSFTLSKPSDYTDANNGQHKVYGGENFLF